MAARAQTAAESTTLTLAGANDISAIEAIVHAAYVKYVERIGKPPAPMVADYRELVDMGQVYALRSNADGRLVGSIVLEKTASRCLQIGNVVVDPAEQGRGYGRVLLEHAEREARAEGLTALTLYTNVKMWENFGLYAKLGFVEVERRAEAGYERVYFCKALPDGDEASGSYQGQV
ncbi:hypothetical protein HIM_05707 [Hirsutella minnesotensis 3608]|uniref:N-acetyltransferase domain-containing protein n=1 Tax=Hirsutella minnesotensis 3608 TaxID=1043627 RepID=A0A0F7ZK50_9HYPO|nr:hypothetical protein HIM_05707 [Hirsutella minnesotensis 3608]